MRKCPFTNCKKSLPDNHFACLRHWLAMPADEQSKAVQAVKAYYAGQVDIKALRERQRQIVDRVEAQGNMPS